jgi:hypothetical protein
MHAGLIGQVSAHRNAINLFKLTLHLRELAVDMRMHIANISCRWLKSSDMPLYEAVRNTPSQEGYEIFETLFYMINIYIPVVTPPGFIIENSI